MIFLEEDFSQEEYERLAAEIADESESSEGE